MQGFDADAFAAQIAHPYLKRMFAYWLEKAGSRAMPTRADIDPIDMPYALGHIMLVDVERSPLRFRYRLDGSKLTWYFGKDLTGRYTDQLEPPDYSRYVTGVYTNALEAGVPQHFTRNLVVEGQPQRYSVLILPLADDAQPDQIGMLMVGMIPMA